MARFMTFAEIYGKVNDLCDDDSAAMVTAAKAAVNAAYRDLMTADEARPLWFRTKRKTFNLVAGTRSYTDQEAYAGVSAGALTSAGITDLGRIISLSVDGLVARAIDHAYAEAQADIFWDSNQTEDVPRLYMHEVAPFASSTAVAGPPAVTRTRSLLNTLHFFLMPNAAKAVGVVYETAFDALVNDADLPALPPQYHDSLVHGAMVEMEAFGWSAQSAVWGALYEKAKGEMVKENRTLLNEVQEPDIFTRLG